MATRESMSNEAFGAKLCNAYDTYEEHRAAGRLPEDAPGAHEIVNQLTRANREASEARDELGENEGLGPVRIQGPRSERGAGLGPVEIQNKAKDNPPPTPGAPKAPVADPGKPTQDGAPRWGRPHPLEKAIKGYGRLR
ncbi:MAG TPA: hypothetical protein VNR70_14065 [Steroidobacteraceae bacterium]|nr:hypothetical protein [Steroidobacteraceae bacterium]